MRVIPVIDLKGGVAVHAVRGERERYRPVRSRIAAGSDPVELTRAVRDRFGLDEVYVADLDAIAGGAGNGEVVAALAGEARVMVDAGTSTAGAVARMLDLEAARVIVGTESLPGVEAFRVLRAELADAPLVVSLDLRAGRVLSPIRSSPASMRRRRSRGSSTPGPRRRSCSTSPASARARARTSRSWRTCTRGSRTSTSSRAAACATRPTSALSPHAGAAGALVATALHGGAIAAGRCGRWCEPRLWWRRSGGVLPGAPGGAGTRERGGEGVGKHGALAEGRPSAACDDPDVRR